MKETVAEIRALWQRSRWYRVALVAAAIYFAVRLLVQAGYLGVMLFPEWGLLPEWAAAEGPMVPIDLQVYLDAAENFRQHRDLYLQDALNSIEYHFPYPPSYAMVFVPFLWLSPLAVSVTHTLLHLLAYLLLYLSWDRIFRRLGLSRARETLVKILPLWAVFPVFWSDLGYLNIYIVMALLATLLIEALLYERLGWSLLWLSLILQTKPMWAFAVALPLVLRRYRFLLKLLGLTCVVYLAVVGTTILIAGPSYGWEQYGDYLQILLRLGGDFPWRLPTDSFFGYNHSIKQILIYFLGLSPENLAVATVVKLILLLPLILVCLRYALQPSSRPAYEIPYLSLDLIFALYLGAFIWLDIVWEVGLSIVVFGYLLATLEKQWIKSGTWGVFLPYLLIDPLRVLGGILALLGLNTILLGPYIVTDLSLYVPITMVVILAFYGALLRRLWAGQTAYVAQAASPSASSYAVKG